MSHIGKQPVVIPEGVEVDVQGQEITVKGPKGVLVRNVNPLIKIEKKEGEVVVLPKSIDKSSVPFWGTERALINNMVLGVKEGFQRNLILEGVGYRGEVKDGVLILDLGFSHRVKFPTFPGINFEVKGKVISISGIEKEKVNQVAAKIRSTRVPNVYTGKGIRYNDEVVRRKSGKKAVGSE